MDTKARVNAPDTRQPPKIIDRVFSIILLVAQPVVAVANFFFVALTESDWPDGTRSVPHWAATAAILLVFLIPLAAAVVTIVMLAKRRIAFWVPLLALALTSIIVGALVAYGQTPAIL